MSDPFFVSSKFKQHKSTSRSSKATKNKKFSPQGKPPLPIAFSRKKRKVQNHDTEEESISSDGDEIGPGNIDDMDMDHNFDDGDDDDETDQEEKSETLTEKRRRLAKQYIESVREGLGI